MGATIRTTVLLLFMFMLFGVIGLVVVVATPTLDLITTMAIFLVIAAAINIAVYFLSSKLVLMRYKAQIVSAQESPRLHKIVQEICLRADLPMPKIAIVNTATPNAFATGRNKKNAVVAATTGLLDILSDDELKGVLAHEMAHVKDKDILVMSIAATLASAISIAARSLWWGSLGGRRDRGSEWIVLLAMITVPIAAMFLQLGISRGREYYADRQGAMMIQKPMALARALAKLENGNRKRPLDVGNPASASLFIVNPFRGKGVLTLFSTHPPIEERIKRLEDLAQTTGYIG